MAKSGKLCYQSEFELSRRSGVKFPGRFMVLVVVNPAPTEECKAGVICGRKFNLLAVKRNRARRLLWESLRNLNGQLPAIYLVMLPRPALLKAKEPEVRQEMQKLLRRAGVLNSENCHCAEDGVVI